MKKTSSVKAYVTACYLTFWLMVLVLCGGASMVFHAPPLVMRLLSNVCAWSPTFVLLIMWKRLRPEQTRREFFSECFSGRLRLWLLLLPALLTAGASLLAALITVRIQGREPASCFSLGGYPLAASFFLSLLSGPTGEEAGWRGYLRVELSKKHGFLTASVLQGLIWAFWHAVLWFVDSDFSGIQLLPYIAANVIVMTCLAVIMNVVLEKENNLIYSVLIHFAFNFVYCFLRVDIWFYLTLSVAFLILAGGFLLYRRQSVKRAEVAEKCVS